MRMASSDMCKYEEKEEYQAKLLHNSEMCFYTTAGTEVLFYFLISDICEI